MTSRAASIVHTSAVALLAGVMVWVPSTRDLVAIVTLMGLASLSPSLLEGGRRRFGLSTASRRTASGWLVLIATFAVFAGGVIASALAASAGRPDLGLPIAAMVVALLVPIQVVDERLHKASSRAATAL